MLESGSKRDRFDLTGNALPVKRMKTTRLAALNPHLVEFPTRSRDGQTLFRRPCRCSCHLATLMPHCRLTQPIRRCLFRSLTKKNAPNQSTELRALSTSSCPCHHTLICPLSSIQEDYNESTEQTSMRECRSPATLHAPALSAVRTPVHPTDRPLFLLPHPTSLHPSRELTRDFPTFLISD